jgi:small subunit ribosomal protein S8
MDFEILHQLQKYGFIKSAKKLGRLPKRMIEIGLHDPDAEGAIHGVRFISKPSRMLYRGYRDIRPVQQGYGIAVVSTSKGIMTDKEVRKLKVGGVYLFEVW